MSGVRDRDLASFLYTVFPAPLVDGAVFSPIYASDTFIKTWMAVSCLGLFLYAVPLVSVYASGLVPAGFAGMLCCVKSGPVTVSSTEFSA